ncbi:hypothetical protein JKA74_11650 [Marivirga sp. S37H4]|uniref:Uncharacterized protein n=1 Tax=Marivirga aurantiaca TaxID=2802615 RepID=A0A935CC14_9BACT|nr:hypothetical protein [Marivirga aurantiaca]MBK6265693.1 hypothetical protein [Marivirga aurantiaca]
MSNDQVKIKLKGFNVSKNDFEEKYNVQLSDIEWGIIAKKINSSWEEHIQEVRLLAFKHIRAAMNDIGYTPSLEGKDISFKSTDS